MKYVVYILTALLAAAVIVILLLGMLSYIDHEYDYLTKAFSEAYFWYSIAIYSINIMSALALGILAIMQLKTSTPRLILFFSGAVFFGSINMLFLNWWCGLICIAAGLLPSIYELIKHGRLIKKSPRQWQRNGNLLIIAGIIECIIMAYGIYKFLNNLNRALLFNMQDVDYYNIAISIAHGICIAVFCFLRYRRTSVLYRIFLIAPSVVGIILIPGQIAVTLIGMATSDHFSTTWSPIEAILFLAPTLLILIHALKTRHDGILPQEPEADMQQPLTSVV